MTESSFDKIKKLVKIIGGKVIVVEDGIPTMVLINIDEYVDFNKTRSLILENLSKDKSIDRINKDIDVWKDKQEKRKVGQFKNNVAIKDAIKDSVRGNKNSDKIIVEKI